MIRELVRDAVELAKVARGGSGVRDIARSAAYDAYAVLVLTRIREAVRRWHVPGVNHVLRLTQMAVYGIEIGNQVTLGRGVYVVHSLGTVIGGTAKIGDRVRFMGNNTVGSAKDDGCPILEDDVVVGCGARILGPIRIGARARIGANAVVVHDVPADAVATGIPAVVRTPSR
jgi:serine O-acetyltransferase